MLRTLSKGNQYKDILFGYNIKIKHYFQKVNSILRETLQKIDMNFFLPDRKGYIKGKQSAVFKNFSGKRPLQTGFYLPDSGQGSIPQAFVPHCIRWR